MQHSSFHMDGFLGDDLLVEILHRLPLKSAITCKCVSKRWLALISAHYFLRRFIHRQRSFLHKLQNHHDKQCFICPISSHSLMLTVLPRTPSFQEFPIPPKQQDLVSLGFLGPDFHARAIRGCSNGLLLCSKFPCTPFENETYYVCNPLTKDWIQLPPPLQIPKATSVSVGFIFDPYYCIKAETGTVTLSSCSSSPRFRVVLFPYFKGRKFEFQVQVFSSETKQWRWSKLVVSCLKGFARAYIAWPGAAYQGKLHFVGLNSILVYDPFNKKENEPCHTIDLPISSSVIFGFLGVSCGNLRISQTQTQTNPFPSIISRLSVWELKCYSGSNCYWHLVKRVNLPRNVYNEEVKAFHPLDGDIVYLNSRLGIISLNLHTLETEMIGYNNKETLLSRFSLELPWWPHSIPSI